MSKNFKHIESIFTPEDIVTIKIIKERNEFKDFVISYRAKINNKWYQIIRTDTAHGYLHMQKFWISPKPIKLSELKSVPLKLVFDMFWKDLKDNWKRYRKNMERKVRRIK